MEVEQAGCRSDEHATVRDSEFGERICLKHACGADATAAVNRPPYSSLLDARAHYCTAEQVCSTKINQHVLQPRTFVRMHIPMSSKATTVGTRYLNQESM